MAKRNIRIYRCTLFNFGNYLFRFGGRGPQTEGVVSRWTKNLQAIGEREVLSGELVEMSVKITEASHPLNHNTRVRFEILEEDHILTGWLDDRIISYLGTGTPPSSEEFPTVRKNTHFQRMAPGETLQAAVESFKALHPADFNNHILIFEQAGDRPAYNIIAWWEAQRLEDFVNSEFYFIVNVDDVFEDQSEEILDVTEGQAETRAIGPSVWLRLRGRMLDAHPFDPNVPEPLPNVEIRGGGRTATTNAAGEYTLDGFFVFDNQNLEVSRPGVDALVLRVNVSGATTGPVTIIVSDTRTRTEYARVVRSAPLNVTAPIDTALTDLSLIVHKIHGKVFWPDSRRVNDRNYTGTPLAGKRVYVSPLAEGAIGQQRPADSSTWATLKSRPDIHRSGRPGRFTQGELTAHDGAFEIKFIDLSVDRRYFVWVESLDLTTNVESPEYMVRTFYVELLELIGSSANLVANVGRHLIDHTYNLTVDPVRWGVESFKVVNWTLDTGGVETRAIRPQRDAKAAYETLQAAGERLNFDPATKILSDYNLQCLPVVPIFEASDKQSDHARTAHAGLQEAMDRVFPRGHFADEVRFVLDARRIVTAIDLSVGVWDGVWNPGDVNTSRQRRLCELLEKTFLVSPQLPSAHLPRVEDARWRFDAITLADYALISIPIPPPLNQAVVANRRLDADWVPVLQPVSPRLVGLAAGRHLFLAPGHGFFDDNPPSNNPADWRSERGGYNFGAGEDENDAYMAAEVDSIARRQGMLVTPVRELRDFTISGVVHPVNNVFNPSPNPNFLRLWQQNPMYFLGSQRNAIIVGPGTNLGQLAGDHNDKGIEARWRLAAQLAGGANPIDIFLAIHTNALNGVSRGVSAIYLNVTISTVNPNEANTIGQDFATRLRDRIVDRCHANRRNVVSVRQLGNPIADLQRTFDHWTQNIGGTSAHWPRVRNAPPAPAAWNHRTFPRTIPVALLEVAFHDNTEDAALLSRAWFRRLAGEAMAFAVEEQLRSDPNPITRADMVRLLTATFGLTARIRGLVANNNAIGGDIGNYIQTATGEVVPVPANNLDAAVTAIEAATNRYTRSDFVTDLRDILADRAGYDANAAADIENFVTILILAGGTLANMRRPNTPVSRSEAASFIATAFGWSPATLNAVINQQVGGTTLMQQLDGADHPDKYLPRIEAQDLMGRIRGLNPQHIYRIIDLYLADEMYNRLSESIIQPGQPPQYSVRAGSRITLVADTKGTPWQADLNDLRFSISDGSGFNQVLTGSMRTRSRLGSVVWNVSLPTQDEEEPQSYRISISINHRTQANQNLQFEKEIHIFVLPT